ncbi:uncharacterized protein LOC143429266 [Xylocopa sonorina]|uniref:uncharacterized protein LOC143429266 n=1 Tax=Xylocopa sonorina TaxID=1818115 RepID=UPI00403AACDC
MESSVGEKEEEEQEEEEGWRSRRRKRERMEQNIVAVRDCNRWRGWMPGEAMRMLARERGITSSLFLVSKNHCSYEELNEISNTLGDPIARVWLKLVSNSCWPSDEITRYVHGGGFFAFRSNHGNNFNGRGLKLLTPFTNRDGTEFHINLRICTYIHIHTYICIYMYIYVYICIYTTATKEVSSYEIGDNPMVFLFAGNYCTHNLVKKGRLIPQREIYGAR